MIERGSTLAHERCNFERMTTKANARVRAGAATCLLLIASTGCATRPDIRGTSSEAQDWAEQQKKEDAESKGKSALPTVHEPVAPPPPAAH